MSGELEYDVNGNHPGPLCCSAIILQKFTPSKRFVSWCCYRSGCFRSRVNPHHLCTDAAALCTAVSEVAFLVQNRLSPYITFCRPVSVSRFVTEDTISIPNAMLFILSYPSCHLDRTGMPPFLNVKLIYFVFAPPILSPPRLSDWLFPYVQIPSDFLSASVCYDCCPVLRLLFSIPYHSVLSSLLPLRCFPFQNPVSVQFLRTKKNPPASIHQQAPVNPVRSTLCVIAKASAELLLNLSVERSLSCGGHFHSVVPRTTGPAASSNPEVVGTSDGGRSLSPFPRTPVNPGKFLLCRPLIV